MYDGLSSRITDSRVFSKLGLKWGYMKLKLANESRFMTAFVTTFGVFQSYYLAPGISSGPVVIASILAGINDVFNFSYDILVCTSTAELNDKMLPQVLHRLAELIFLRVEKCLNAVSEL